MTIETKFNIGDEVWLMYENMAITAQVIEMNVEIREYIMSEYAPERWTRTTTTLFS